ncbi:MAG: alpha-L-rhamnosidase [Actinomyces ruminicola]|nr:alpha-L-rhamnosidase [Actinomyces ruminicola]
MPTRADWAAQFITSPVPAGGPEDPAVYLRRSFDVEPGLVKATLHATAVGLIEPHLNGAVVGEEVLTPGWTSYAHRLLVSSHDVTELLHQGRNAVGAIIGQGWAVGRLGWDSRPHLWSDQPAGWIQLDLDYGDHVETIASGPDFTAGAGGLRNNGIYDGETFDATAEPIGWDQADFDDSTWTPAQSFDWDAELQTRTAPGITRTEELPPVSIARHSEQTIVDFGQILAGWVRLTVTGAEPGTTITLRHGELLHADGTLDVRTLRSAKATDRWILAGPESSTFEPRFTFHGFRYVEISGLPADLDPADIRAVVVHSPMARTGWFTSSNELLNRLHENAIWSMRGNFVGLPTDCPQRDERLGWTGDINAFAPTAVLLHDAEALLRSWLTDLRLEQAATGLVPWVVPDTTETPSSPTALWSDVAVGLPWTLYQEYGDPAILAESYDSMAAFTRQVEGLLDEHSLWSTGFQFGDWLDPDAPQDDPSGAKTDRHLVASAYFCLTTRQMARTAEILGRTDDAAHFNALATRVREAFRREHVTAAGRVTGESATAYALAICFDILDAEQIPTAGKRLAELVAKTGYTISTGFAGTPWVLPALAQAEQWQAAYQLLTQTRCPSFLYPVSMGATTIWERWDAILPDGELNDHGMTSLNHYALGAVAAWLYEEVAGLQRLAPGWSQIRIAPHVGGGLTHARAEHTTVLGTVAAGWRIEDRTMYVEVTVPEGAQAEVVLPLDPAGRSINVGPGAHDWAYDLPTDYGSRPDLSMDTPLAELATDATMWTAIQKVFAAYLPGIPIDASDPQAGTISLNLMFQFIPHPPRGFREDLEATLADPSHADGVRPPA